MTKFINLIENINSKIIFYITSFLFGMCYICEVPHGDDVTTLSIASSRNCKDIALKIIEIIRIRGIVSADAIQFILFNNLPIIFFSVYIMFIMFLLLNSISKLIEIDNKYRTFLNVFISCAIMTYSYVDLQSAGWIVTTCCYFVPLTFTIVSLLPIKKFLENKTLTKKEYILYSFALIIAVSGAYQGLACMDMCYFFIFLYCAFTKKEFKKNYVFVIILLVFSVATLTDQSTIGRTAIEIQKRMPAFEMYNLLNKIDIGFFSTMGWLIFGKNNFIPFLFVVMSILINEKYHKIHLTLFCFSNEIIRLVFSHTYLSNLSINAFDLQPKTFATSNYGLFNLESISKLSTYIMYFVICIVIINTIVQMYLLCDNEKTLYIVSLILLVGFISRFILMLTPNIFGSQQRTFIYLNFSIILSTIIIFSKNITMIDEKKKEYLIVICLIILFIELCYFFTYVYNYMGHSLFDLLR